MENNPLKVDHFYHVRSTIGIGTQPNFHKIKKIKVESMTELTYTFLVFGKEVEKEIVVRNEFHRHNEVIEDIPKHYKD